MPRKYKTVAIKRIIPFGEEEVFDITTRSHVFIANGVVAHNSMATPAAAGALALALEHGLISSVADVKAKMAGFGVKTNDAGYGRLTWSKLGG